VLGCPSLRSDGSLTVGFVGCLHEGKGWELVGHAVRALREKGHPIRLLLAGTGPPREVTAAARICTEISNGSGFLGWVPDAGRNLMPQLDVLVLPSAVEGMPMAALEALAAGVPIIATPVGGLRDAIADGQEGFLIPRNLNAITDKLRLLLGDKGLLGAMSAAARSRYEREFGVGAMGERYERLYLRLRPT